MIQGLTIPLLLVGTCTCVVPLRLSSIRQYHTGRGDEVYLETYFCRFRLLQKITTDSGTQFTGRAVEIFCSEYGIQLSFSSIIYPQGNGQAESSNKIIFDCIKKDAEGSERKLGCKITERPMDVPENKANGHRRNAFCHGVWNM